MATHLIRTASGYATRMAVGEVAFTNAAGMAYSFASAADAERFAAANGINVFEVVEYVSSYKF